MYRSVSIKLIRSIWSCWKLPFKVRCASSWKCNEVKLIFACEFSIGTRTIFQGLTVIIGISSWGHYSYIFCCWIDCDVHMIIQTTQRSTIPDKTTWESFPHHVHFPTQQNYFQNDAFAERKPLPPIQCCFPQTPRDQAFFWIHNNIASGEVGEGRTGTATMFRKMLSQYTIFSTVLSKIVATDKAKAIPYSNHLSLFILF